MNKLTGFWKSGPLGKIVLILTPLVILFIVCLCLVGGGVIVWKFLPNLPTNQIKSISPPTVIDSLSIDAGGGAIQDEFGVSLEIMPDALESGQQAYLERANLSQGMQREIENAYQVDSLLYSVVLQDGQDGTGRVELALPAKSPDSRLAVLVDDQWLGILETPAQDGFFHVTPGLSLAAGVQTYMDQGAGVASAPNRYLVLTPKPGTSQVPQNVLKMADLMAQTDPDGKSCIAEFWTINHCWRNNEGSVYVFWQSDVPESLKDQEYLRIIDTIKEVSALMGSYQKKGFTAAAISSSNPAYVIIEAGAKTPYYSWKTGNVYFPWDIVSGIGNSKSRCTLAHEFFHWIEDEEYRMGAAALSGPKSWWVETSAENGSYLIDSSCIENTLKEYGGVESGNVLAFQAAPMLWDSDEEGRYIHALQLYLSICDGGNCAMSQETWVQAINDGSYPMEGNALTAYETNAKDLGRFLLGAAPEESRVGAEIPASAITGDNFGDFLTLKTGYPLWEYGVVASQFKKISEQQVNVEARVAKGGVYPLSVSNGGVTPGGKSLAGLPGLLEIQPGPAFWLKQDASEPVFYPAGTNLKLGPISDNLGIGKVRIVAVAPDSEQLFQASLSLADLTGDWVTDSGDISVTPIDCVDYSEEEGNNYSGDMFPLFFSMNGTYVKDPDDPDQVNLIWEGTIPAEYAALSITGSSEVEVFPDKVVLHYFIDVPKPTSSSGLVPWLKPGQTLVNYPVHRRSDLLAGLAFLPASVGIAWLHNRRRKWSRVALVVQLMLVTVWLSSCLGSCDFTVWGTFEGTYTFKKMEYVDPGQAAADPSSDSDSQPVINWTLDDGEVVTNLDLTIALEVTDEEGATTEEISPCKLVINSNNGTGFIGPDGSFTEAKD